MFFLLNHSRWFHRYPKRIWKIAKGKPTPAKILFFPYPEMQGTKTGDKVVKDVKIMQRKFVGVMEGIAYSTRNIQFIFELAEQK